MSETLRQVFAMSRYRPYSPPKPTAIWPQSVSAEVAREIMGEYLSEYSKPIVGHFIPLSRFVQNFVRWVDRNHGPVASNWFAQKTRVRRVLQDVAAPPIGYWQPDREITFGIGNLALPGSAPVSERPLIVESDAPGLECAWLMPKDLTSA